jgi:hypothetical protein
MKAQISARQMLTTRSTKTLSLRLFIGAKLRILVWKLWQRFAESVHRDGFEV